MFPSNSDFKKKTKTVILVPLRTNFGKDNRKKARNWLGNFSPQGRTPSAQNYSFREQLPWGQARRRWITS